MKTKYEHYEEVMNITGFNTRVLNFKYLGPTSHRGSRVKISDPRFNKSIIIDFDYRFNESHQVAVSYLLENGWSIAGFNSAAGVIIISEWNAEQQLK